MKWTDAQRQTIESRNKNILVSAAAGSGKTAVLIERIKQLVIKDKTDIDQFLITTFTNAASMEMKERLEKAIRTELEKQDSDKKFLKKQLNLIPKANIGTFHNFALEIIRRYFYLTELEPGFRIGDEIQVSILKNESVDEVFDTRFNEDYELFREFLKKYSSDRNENKIKSGILILYNELRSIPHYMTWAEERTELLNSRSPVEAMGLMEFVLEDSAEKLKEAVRFYREAFDLIESEGIEGLSDKAGQDVEMLENVAGDVEEAVKLLQYKDAKDVYTKTAALLEAVKFNTMRVSKDQQENYNQIKENVASFRKAGKKLIDDIKKKYFSRPYNEYDEELKAGYEDTKYLVGIIKDFETVFKAKKQEKNIIDFDDVMHYAIDILDNDMAASEYRDRFSYIFIDEFQDSNMLQEMIVERISKDNNLFMVGDVKQSIYKFRLAEPEIFRRKYDLYRRADETLSEKIDLNSNFRSKSCVTDTVNYVFENIMDDYDENAKLNCTIDRIHPGYESRVTVIDKNSGESDILRENGQIEAAAAAEIIRANLGMPIYDVKADRTRPLEYRDIVVLSRSKSMISEIEKYLNNDGIPAFGDDPGGYFESVEIQVFINLLKIIDNSRRDIPLISVMHSIIFDFDVKELARIRIEFREGSFYEAVKSYSMEGQVTHIKEKILKMMQQLKHWKAMKKTVTLEELIRVLLYDTGYFDYCSGLPVGHQRISNLRMLVEKASEFEQNNYSGLYGFLTYIEAMKKNNLTIGEAKSVGENDNVVRIMTVHKSKGLEFPVVILAGAGRTIKFRGMGSSAVMHKDLAIGLPHVNREECWHRKTLLQRVIEGKKAGEELEEEIRILYVALTRAMDKLEILATVNDIEKIDSKNPGKKSFLEMMYASLISTKGNICIKSAGAFYDETAETSAKKLSVADLLMKAENNIDEDKLRLIDEKLSYEYPYHDMASVKSKYSVTELNSASRDTYKDIPLAKPEFSFERTALNAAEIGTAMHTVMEKMDFAKAYAYGKGYLQNEIEQLTENGYLTQQEAAAVNTENILGFFDSDVGRKAAAAETLHKEREFILLKEIDGTQAIVQGVIDCYFEDEDGLVLIDYKNSYVGNTVSEEEILRRYKEQIALYEEALEAACGKKVNSSYLYMFNLKKFIKAR